MSKEFRWGIISTGGIATSFARDLGFFNDHIVAAVGSRNITSAQRFADEFPGCTPYGSYEELVADPTIDGIYVATPHPMHHANTILALGAGKPVLCEKVFSINAREAQEMIDYAKKNNVMVMEAMWARFVPHMIKVREIIATGVLGEIISVQADHGQRLADYGNDRHWKPELGGGALLDLGIYTASFIHMVLGVPKKITATAALTEHGVDNSCSAIFDYANGAQATMMTNMIAATPTAAVIAGRNGRIEIDGPFYAPSSFRLVIHNGETTEYPKDYKGHGLREQAQEFARCVQSGLKESAILTPAATLEVMVIMDEIRKQTGIKYPGE